MNTLKKITAAAAIYVVVTLLMLKENIVNVFKDWWLCRKEDNRLNSRKQSDENRY